MITRPTGDYAASSSFSMASSVLKGSLGLGMLDDCYKIQLPGADSFLGPRARNARDTLERRRESPLLG